MKGFRYLETGQLYKEFIEPYLCTAKKDMTIATANLKNMRIEFPGGRTRSIVWVFRQLLQDNVKIRILHSDIPSDNFSSDIQALDIISFYPKFDMRLCPRAHFKFIIVDHTYIYTGSANMTGAGMGIRSPAKRNRKPSASTTVA